MRKLEIYVHIPFCLRKCAYCDFLSAPAAGEEQEAYVQTLLAEIAGTVPACARSFSDPFRAEVADPAAAKGTGPTVKDHADQVYRLPDDYVVTSVFIGGGTPSLLPAEQIAGILEALRAQFRFADAPEVTVECNPGTVNRKKLETYQACGINRLSIGLQSADDAELKKLGRIHTWKMFLESYEAAQKAGFTNINIDLMSALPGQTVSSWERTLQNVLALSPTHISAYSLIIEEGTPFYERYHEDDELRAAGEQPRFLPSEEDERQMYERTEELLGNAGLYRYEISNYAKPGYECRHNIGYWRGTEYMGFGLGASSLLRFAIDDAAKNASGDAASCQPRPVSVRLKNPSGHAAYAHLVRQGASPAGVRSGRAGSAGEGGILTGQNEGAGEGGILTGQEKSARKGGMLTGQNEGAGEGDMLTGQDEGAGDCEILSEQDEMAEFMILGLRMTDGVSAQEFARRFGCPVGQIYGETIRKYVSFGLLRQEGDRIFLTPRGLDLSNTVMADFL